MRRMRIIAWSLDDGTPGYTLVMEWFGDGGTVLEDKRYHMEADEFKALKKSVNDAQMLKKPSVRSASGQVRGGQARAEKMTPAQRSEHAKMMADKRWREK
jgi:hypothetical protein